jgi:hypothetical protein
VGVLVGRTRARTREVGVKVGECDKKFKSIKVVGDAVSKIGDGVARSGGMTKRINITSNTTRASRMTATVIIL